MRAQIDEARAPRVAGSMDERDHARTKAILLQAHLHVCRYYRAWLSGTEGGEALADALAVEALVRIAHLPEPSQASTEAEIVAVWLSVARDVAREVAGG